MFGPLGGKLDAAAQYLGLTVSELATKLQSGQSLADVAKAEGKSVEGLKTAMLSDAKAKLDQAVKDGKLTDAQRDQIVAGLESRIDDLVNRKGFAGPDDHFGLRFHHSFFGPTALATRMTAASDRAASEGTRTSDPPRFLPSTRRREAPTGPLVAFASIPYDARVIRRHPWRLALAVALIAGLLAAPHASSMLQRLVANGVSGKVTFREINEGKEQGDQYIGVSGKGTFSGTIRGVSSVAAYVAGKVTGVPYRALAKGGTYAALYDIDAQNNYKGIVVAKFAAPGLGSVCLGLTVKHGSFKPGMSFIPASGSVTIVGGTGQAARFPRQPDVLADERDGRRDRDAGRQGPARAEDGRSAPDAERLQGRFETGRLSGR